MEKKKLTVVNLELGVNPELETDIPISPQTEAKIQKIVKDSVDDDKLLDAVREKREHQTIERCLQTLVKATEKNETISATHLLEIAEHDNLVSVMVRIKHLIIKRGSIWVIRKKKVDGVSHYYLIPS